MTLKPTSTQPVSRAPRVAILAAALCLLAFLAALGTSLAGAAGQPQVLSTYATEVTATSATLGAEVNPNGEATTYSFQYVTQEHFDQLGFSEPFSTPEASLGSGAAALTVTAELTGLAPHTAYRYRVVATNSSSPSGGTPGTDRALVTQPPAASLALPDERAWEEVSPPEKHGAAIKNEGGAFSLFQAAAGGDGLAYLATAPLGEEPHTSAQTTSVLSTRTHSGWRVAAEPMPLKSIPEGEVSAAEMANGEFPPFYSADLARTLIEPMPFVRPLAAGATERTLYIWDAASGSYLPLVTPANVETGSSFGGNGIEWMFFDGASSDFSHVVFDSPYPLTIGAPTPPDLPICEANEPCNGERNLYEWSAGRLHLVSVGPSGRPILPARLGRGQFLETDDAHAVSADGRWIIWSHEGSPATLYVRDMTAKRTYQVGGTNALYETMSADGSRVFYLEGGDLHLFETATQAASDLTPPPAGETTAGVRDTILGAAEDGSSLYFVADRVLTTEANRVGEAAQSGEPNLYRLRDTASGWLTTYIATLSPADEPDWYGHISNEGLWLSMVTSHVSPNGRFLAFMSERPLTGYDNVDARSGEPDEELFLYDAQTGHLVCASCNPTGARPHGIFDRVSAENPALFDPDQAWSGHWLAASLPGWRNYALHKPIYDPRLLTDSGRLFFQSADALVPQDTNGKEDVYEYEPTEAGSCRQSDPSYSPASGGCISLISKGTSPQESVFLDASESGNDVFFTTTEALVPQDVDQATDVYDARSPHVASEPVGFPLPPKKPPCEGDACQPPVPAPEDETPGSLSYHGPGNEHRTGHPRCRKDKVRAHGKCVAKRHKKKRSHRRPATHNRGGHK